MSRYLGLVLAVLAVAGCATHAATSGRVVIQDNDGVADMRIVDQDRRAIDEYYRKIANKKGMAPAKRAGSLPPGLRKRDKLPPGVQGESLPVELERSLTKLPTNYIRVRIGPDIVLIDSKTRVVLDVVYGVAG